MTAEEIRKECERNVERLSGEIPEVIQILQYGAQMEVAAQLAELNKNLLELNKDFVGVFKQSAFERMFGK